MPQDKFLRRKKSILAKSDKSSKGEWDKKILSLCNRINSLENYYTTSSCSGRIVIMFDKEKKSSGLFIKKYHDLISFSQLKKDLNEIINKNKKQIKFKQEPCILHVVCRTLEDAQGLYDKAKSTGWKKSGLVSFRRNIIELNSTEKLEFPIINKGKILVNDEFLKVVVKKSNENLKKSWKKIYKLEKLFE